MKLSRQRARLVGCATTAAVAMLGTTLSFTGTATAARVADATRHAGHEHHDVDG